MCEFWATIQSTRISFNGDRGHKAHKRCLLGFGRSFVGEGGPRIELNSFPMPPSGVAAPVSLRAPSIQRNFFRNLCAAVLPFVAATMNCADAVAQPSRPMSRSSEIAPGPKVMIASAIAAQYKWKFAQPSG